MTNELTKDRCFADTARSRYRNNLGQFPEIVNHILENGPAIVRQIITPFPVDRFVPRVIYPKQVP